MMTGVLGKALTFLFQKEGMNVLEKILCANEMRTFENIFSFFGRTMSL